MNPWKGVVPYNENDDHVFLGRKQEIEDLLNLVKQNHIVTLYGRSGIGKTSLLNVGLFPSLIKDYYYPISIRLKNECGKNDSFAKHITECINKELVVEPFGGMKQEDIPMKPEDDIHYLWNYFAYHEFYGRKEKDCIKEGDEVIPVIVLDQFEEVLRDSDSRAKAVTLINQIHSTLQDGFLHDGTPYTIAFRFVISLREDDLYLLEDLLDEQYIDTMKRGRFRLRPLETQAAKEIIFIEPDLFTGEDGEKKRIIEKIVLLSDQEGQISTLLLSLVCFMIYESAKGRTNLRVKDITELIGEKPLDTFYYEAVKELDNETMDWIEFHFTKDDRKSPVSLDSIPLTIWQEIKKYKLDDESYDHHLFTSSSRSNESVELLHDKLAVAMNEYRKNRIKEQKADLLKRKVKRGIMILMGIVLVFASFFVIKYFATRHIEFNRGCVGKNQVIPNNRQYKFKDGTLRLSKCCVLPNTFCNKDVRRLEIDSVKFIEGVALYLPNLDTIVLGGNDYNNDELFNDSIQSVKVLIAKRPNMTKDKSYNTYILHGLDTVVIAANDYDCLRWHNGVLYLRDIDEQNKWYAKFKRSGEKPYYYSEAFPNCNVLGADPLQLYDIANPPEKLDNTSIKLICSDPNYSCLKKQDIPDDIKDNVVIMEFPYIDSIENDFFNSRGRYSNSRRLQTLICSNVSKIGDSSFIYCKQLKTIELPKVKHIGSYAFYSDNMLKNIKLDSVRFIGDHAFEYIYDLKEIYLPVVEEIGISSFYNISEKTKCNYNPMASLGKNTFGYNKSPLNSYGKQCNPNRKNELGYHYSSKKDTLYIDSSYVANLEIVKEVRQIKCSTGISNSCIDKVSLHRENLNYFIWKGDLYKYDKSKTIGIVIETNREKYVSLPSEINRSNLITGTSANKTKIKDYIALNPTDLNNYVGEDVVLWVPSKQKDKFFPWENSFAEIRELSWIQQVLCYKVFYGHPHIPLKVRSKMVGAEWSDWIAVISCGLFMLALLMVFHFVKFRKNKKWWHWLRDIFIMIIIGGIIWCIVMLTEPVKYYYQEGGLSFHSLEELYVYLKDNNLLGTRAMSGWKYSFSIWPIWCFAPEIWLIYLLLTSKLHKKKEETKCPSNK